MYATSTQIATELTGEVERNDLVICEAPSGCGKTAAMCAAIVNLLCDKYVPATAETCHALVLCPNNDSAYYIYKLFLQLCAATSLTGTLVMPKHVTSSTNMSTLVNVNIVVASLTILNLFNHQHRFPRELSAIKLLVLSDCFRSVGAWQEHHRVFKLLEPASPVKIIGLTAKLNALSKDMCQSMCELFSIGATSICTKVSRTFSILTKIFYIG